MKQKLIFAIALFLLLSPAVDAETSHSSTILNTHAVSNPNLTRVSENFWVSCWSWPNLIQAIRREIAINYRTIHDERIFETIQTLDYARKIEARKEASTERNPAKIAGKIELGRPVLKGPDGAPGLQPVLSPGGPMPSPVVPMLVPGLMLFLVPAARFKGGDGASGSNS